MRIFSDFKDYYDSAAAFGADRNIVYQRREIDEVIDKVDLIQDVEARRPRSMVKYYRFRFGIVGFCGNIYPFVICGEDVCNRGKVSEHYIYDAQAFKNYVKDNELEKYTSIDPWMHEREIFSNAAIQKFFSVDSWKSWLPKFHELKVPIFLVKAHRGNVIFVVNPQLSDIKFFQVKDAFGAFQDIASYISGVLGNQPSIPLKIDDKDLIVQKGFDSKSFRTDSPGKKRSRRKYRP